MAFALMDQTSHQAIIDDCWISLQRALGCANSTSGEETVTQMIEFAERNQSHLFSGVLEQRINVSAEAGVLILDLLIRGRDNFADTALVNCFQILRRLPNVADVKGTFSQVLMAIALDAADALLEFRLEKPSEPLWCGASDQFHRLAVFLSENSHHTAANACAQSSVNLTASLGTEKQIPVAKAALAIAIKEGDDNAVAGSAFRYAQVLINHAVTNNDRQLQAYDAVEFAVRNLPTDPQIRSSFAKYLDYVTRKDAYLQPLGFLLWTRLEPHERKQFPQIGEQQFQSVAALNEQISSLAVKEWYKALLDTGSWITFAENHRLGLDHSPKSRLASAVWDTWTFEHPSLMRAIPHATSIRRQPRLDDFLLTLSHEITHVFSMAGALGLATAAIRWALFELEIELWSLSFKQPGFTTEEVPEYLIADDVVSPYAWWKLTGDDLAVHRLARLEQLLELARKVQIVEDAWSPWFEGLAIFGEAADPELDNQTYSPVASVISQLEDAFTSQVAKEEKKSIQQVALEKQAAAEKLYATAIKEAGKSRLRLHLEKYYDRYLAGYLAVRSVVAAWRHKLPFNLSGTEAFRILLHATRWSAFTDLLPDISMDLSEFESAVYEKQYKWLLSLLNISSVDIERVLAASNDGSPPLPCRWEAGQLIMHVPGSTRENVVPELLRIASEALDFRRQAPAELRVPKADDDCVALMHAVRTSLRPLTPQLFAGDRVHWALNGNLIMPIGKVDCPFWLLRQDEMVQCLIRTMETSASGAPSYDVIGFSTESEEFSSLERELLGARGGRMTVTRIADLSDLESVSGKNYIVFQFGSWMHIQPRGLGFGSSKVSDSIRSLVGARLRPDPFKAAMRRFTDLRGVAERATMFLKSFDPLVKTAGLKIEVNPWLQHVQDLVMAVDNRIIGKPHERVAVACASLATASNADAESLQKHGLAELRNSSAEAVEAFIGFLFDSSRYPLVNLGPDVLHAVSSFLGIRLTKYKFGWDLGFPGSSN